jgi:cell wall-associated NlpC family hydrolase
MDWRRIAAISTAFAFLCLAQAQEQSRKVVLGKLGQSVKAAPIYASASSRSRMYYRAKPYEYLVIQSSSKPEWLRVLLENGVYGYVKAELVARLPYDVTMDAPARVDAGIASRSRAAVAQWGLQFQGTPYKWGGNDPLRGIDCSGFVKFLYGQIGLNLPRTAAEQALVGQPIRRLEDLRQGDRLYFWDSKRGKIGHTGLYLGNGYFVHSSSGKGGVSTDYLGASKWLKSLAAARR